MMSDGKGEAVPVKAHAADAGMDTEIQEKLGARLKDAYAHVINEPVPDRFLALLDQLAASDGLKGSKGADDEPDDG